MNRSQTYSTGIDNTDRRHSHLYSTSSLRQHIRQKWLSTLFGLAGLLAAVILIVENEANAARTSKFLEETKSMAVPITPDGEVDKSNIGKLVFLSGVITIHEPLTEVDYGISILAVKLLRQVQMYQWVETEHDTIDGNGNTISSSYSYHKEWNNYLIDSSHFHASMGHQNPKEFPIKRQTQINENVKIGNYYLGSELKKKFKNFVPVTSDERPEKKEIKLHAGMYYHSQNIWNPDIGDVRVQFFYSGQHNQLVTIIAQLDESLTLVPFTVNQSSNMLFLKIGPYTMDEMFASVHLHNKFLTWIIRGGGWFLLYVSCESLGTLLQIVVSYSHFLQEILPVTHSSMKMTVSMCLSLLITALAWVWYRPILGIGLIVVTMSLLYFNKWFSNSGSSNHYNTL